MFGHALKNCVALLLGALLLYLPLAGTAAAPLVLDSRTARLDLWPAVTVMPDPAHEFGIDRAIAARDVFEPPGTARGTLGMRPEPVWMHVPVRVDASAAGHWVLEIDYPLLNHLDVYLVQAKRVVAQAVLGNMQTVTQRPGRSPAMSLHLTPGLDYALFLRVETSGSMVVPARLKAPGTYLADSLREQMLQGLMLGLSVCLILYSMVNWIGFRDSVFGKYALLVCGGMLLSIHQFGVGAQFLWHGQGWLQTHLAIVASLMSAGGFFLFFEHVLAGPFAARHFSPLMKAGAVCAGLVGLGHIFDFIGTQTAAAFVVVLGLLPSVIALPEAIKELRRGNEMALYILLAALVYFCAAGTMMALLYGRLPATFLTQHSVQLASVLDTLLLMRLLSLRSKAIRTEVLRATTERDALHSLAFTDPLTGLPNRRGMSGALAAALHHCSEDRLLGVYFLDLDGFKPVNDQHGHEIGDELLVAVAARLRKMLREDDVVARLGGDEFVVLVPGLHSRARSVDFGGKLLEAFTEPFELSSVRCRVGLTIGCSLAPLDGVDALQLLKQADAAMYVGKQEGKNCLRHYDAEAEVLADPLGSSASPA